MMKNNRQIPIVKMIPDYNIQSPSRREPSFSVSDAYLFGGQNNDPFDNMNFQTSKRHPQAGQYTYYDNKEKHGRQFDLIFIKVFGTV